MRALRAALRRLLSLVRGRADADFEAELESHLQMHTDDNIRAGMSPAEARRQAVLRLGGLEAVKERQRDRAGVPIFQHLWRDVTYGARVMRRAPAFTAVAVATLALGIGANTSIFTVVNAVLLRPLPYADPERLVLIWSTDETKGTREISSSYPDFETWRDQTRSFEGVAALTSRMATLGGDDLAELIPAIQTTPDFFRVLGVRASLGRVFGEADGAADAAPVAVLSDAAWMRQFGGRGDIVGATISVNRRPHTVIGVVPSAMHFIPTEVEQVYTLLPRETQWSHGYLRVVARLRAGVTLEAARAELDLVARRTAAEQPATHAGTGATAVSLVTAVGAPVRQGLLILLSIVGAILLIACTNVANLMLARNASRQQELALRVSLGAARGRILQQLLVESLMLALLGGVAGILLATLLTSGLLWLLSDNVPVPALDRIGLDVRVLFYAFALSVGTGLLFGVVPAAVAAPGRMRTSIREAGRAMTGGRAAQRTRAVLVVVETALALVLLATGAMLGRSFLQLRATAPGFGVEDVLAIGIRLPETLAPAVARETFFETLRAQLERLPGVRAVGGVSSLPMAGGSDSLQLRLPDVAGAKPVSAMVNLATPGYFKTMRIPVVAGREFTADDGAAAPAVAVVNQAAARRFWQGSNPIGRRILFTGAPTPVTVVGVTGDVRQSDLATAPRSEVFLSALQPGPDWNGFALVVQASGDPMSLVPDVRGALRAVNPDVAISRIATVEEVVAGRLAQPRIYTMLLGVFAVVALSLAAVGLYGVIAYSVTQRTRELGIRLALGSTPAALAGSVLRDGTTLTAVGVAIGLAGAYVASQSVAGLLPGSRAGDPITLAGVAALMLLVGAAASYIPARRAGRVDPLAALRAE